MKIEVLRQIRPFFFSSGEAAEVLRTTRASGRVACHRYVQRKLLVRVKRDVYVLAENWRNADQRSFYALANRLQVPSYVSFTTALSFHEKTTQIQRDFFESAAVIRTSDREIGGIRFRHLKIQKKLYFGFVKKDGFFIATPEKALLDSLYLASLHRYRFDGSAVDLDAFDPKELKRQAGFFPPQVRALLEKYVRAR